jgi:hypothetical protein
MYARLATVLFGLALVQAAAQTPPAGSIRGVLLADDGQPLAHATVFAMGEQDTRQMRTTTDQSGRFLLEAVPAGSVDLSAFNDQDWYPYNFFAFFNTTPTVHVRIAAKGGGATDNVVIRMGPRAGALNLDVVNADGATVSEGVNLIFTREDIPGEYRRGGGGYPILVPPVPFRLTVVAPGYQPWHSNVLKPESMKTIDLRVQMKPLAP